MGDILGYIVIGTILMAGVAVLYLPFYFLLNHLIDFQLSR